MGITPDLVAGAIGQLDCVERLGDPLRRAVAVEGREQLEVAPAREVGVESRGLDETGHPVERVDALPGVVAEHTHAPLGRTDQAEHHPQRGRLTGPVRPEEAIHITDVDRDVDAGNGGQVAVALDQPPYLQRWRHRARAAASAAAEGTDPTTV